MTTYEINKLVDEALRKLIFYTCNCGYLLPFIEDTHLETCNWVAAKKEITRRLDLKDNVGY
jgi:hypothetical protein